MAITIVGDSTLFDIFWMQVVHSVVHILNRTQIKIGSNMTLYELWKGRPIAIKHFRYFGSKCYIKINDENLGNFESRSE